MKSSRKAQAFIEARTKSSGMMIMPPEWIDILQIKAKRHDEGKI